MKKVIRSNKRLRGKERIQTIKNNRDNNSKIFFKKVNEVKHGYKARQTVMKRSNGTLLTQNKVIACEFKDIFEKLLNQLSKNTRVYNYTTVEQLLEKPLEEIEIGLDMLKTGKAPDGEIISECLKKGGQGLQNPLINII